MKWIRVFVVALAIVGFSLLSQVAADRHGGFVGLWALGFSSAGNLQILVDLMIASGFAMAWMWNDAQGRNARVWPFLIVTLAIGSFGPLAYLLCREIRALRATEGGEGRAERAQDVPVAS